MNERWITPSSDADEKQESQFETWISGENVPFVSVEAKEAYKARATLIKDSIQLTKAPRRIPICPSAGFFPIQYAGVSMYDAMYDYDVLTQAWITYCKDFTPDAYNAPTTIVPGRVLDILDFKLCRWPGHGVSKQLEYQYVEKAYMQAEEYQDLIDDPTGFFMNVYLPRIFGSLKSLDKIPLLPPVNEIVCVPPALIPFGTEDVQTAFNHLAIAGEETMRWLTAVRRLNGTIMGKGYPAFSGGFTKAPFDVIGDTLRGTKEVLMDMYRHPDELIEACERITPFMIKSGVASCKAAGHIMPFIPLHKGADGFMSDEQFRTFYWPTLRKVIIGLVNEGLVPQLFAEGGYNQRLEVICDVPKGKVVWWFDLTDMSRAKETVGRVACIAGNVPLSLLCTGSPGDVKAYCKNLVEVAGRDGGFIFSTGAGMQGSKAENVRTMIDFSMDYGIYKSGDQ
ncbi:MAG: uroporphyrinogen decarboxylase [Deltaproteobacteria bacterium]|nr:MAG: uroporphyrinogen decarboxylase [Deltaproteobacteria bacterium]